jgi:hypothetical protein
MILHLWMQITPFSFAPMVRKVLRLVMSFVLILSIGYSQLFLLYSTALADLEVAGQEESREIHKAVAHLSSKVKNDHSADQQNQDWETVGLEKDPDDYVAGISIELQLAFAAVFFCILSLSSSKYHVRFLRYCRNFFYKHTHRLHLYHRVFVI